MRIVIDTNIFVSSFFGGIPRQIVESWFSGRIHLCVSRPILKEYLEVLGRFQFHREDLFRRLVTAFEKGPNVLFIDTPKEQNWIEEDPGDNKFIACAIALRAGHIVSGDSHLIKTGKIGGVKIVSPREMAGVIEEEGVT